MGQPTFVGPAQAAPAPGFGGTPGGWNADAMIESWFRRYDKNGDGLLNNDEMPEALQAERDRWDTNKDGFIDLNEFKAYAQARMQQAQADRGSAGGGGPGGPWDAGASPVPEAPADNSQEARPVVYRAGNLPRELPAWFMEADADKDGQVGLYEWKAKGWPMEQFRNMDRNDDGFLTVEEVLRSMKQPADSSASPTAAGTSPGGGTFAQAGGNRRQGGMGGPGRGFPQAGSFQPPGGNGGPGGGFRPPGGNGGPGGGFRPPGGNRGAGPTAP
jgi:hypothetical protein